MRRKPLITGSLLAFGFLITSPFWPGKATNSDRKPLQQSAESTGHPPASENQFHDLQVTFGQSLPMQGKLIVQLYRDAKSFQTRTHPFQERWVQLGDANRPFCEFKSLAEGNYAVAVFLDQNANGKWDSQRQGQQREKFGFSSLQNSTTVNPEFDECQFKLRQNTIMEIQLH
ncbi:MAG: DUF2141 domain-containing protein [Planctomycetota bacterium]|nr:DUF2141 domain-containing protein [Planctomycetota bacterium]